MENSGCRTWKEVLQLTPPRSPRDKPRVAIKNKLLAVLTIIAEVKNLRFHGCCCCLTQAILRPNKLKFQSKVAVVVVAQRVQVSLSKGWAAWPSSVAEISKNIDRK